MYNKICPTCKSIFYKKRNDSKKYWEIKKYCSIKCSGTLLTKERAVGYNTRFKKGKNIGADNPNYKGGKNIAKNGYVRILIPGTGSYKLEHRLIMEKYLGRMLKRTEQIHHKNGIKTDNRLDNLEIMDIKDHSRLETTKRWKDKNKLFRKGLK